MFDEITDFLTKDELEIVNKNILSSDFPWFYQQHATSDSFPFFSHVIYARAFEGGDNNYTPISNSTLSHWSKEIVNRYCNERLGKPLQRIYRSCLNLTYGWNIPYPFIEPHVDHLFDHYNLLVYLNDVNYGGETLLFDKYYCEGMEKANYTVDEYDKVSILERIPAQKGKAICFDGRIYHGMSNFPSDQKRVVLVTTFLA